jgi:hypothetical protein
MQFMARLKPCPSVETCFDLATFKVPIRRQQYTLKAVLFQDSILRQSL